VLPIDLDGDGWTDLLVSNHRRNEVHDADAIVYWGGPDGIDETRTTHLPGWGPHYLTMRDPGNAYDRGPVEWYTSAPLRLSDPDAPATATVERTTIDADVPEGTWLTIEVRVADDEAGLTAAPWTPADTPTPPGRCAQVRAGFGSRTGARSPLLRSIELSLGPPRG
jgi:hypothetical protein